MKIPKIQRRDIEILHGKPPHIDPGKTMPGTADLQRVLCISGGGSGLRTNTHLKAIHTLEGTRAGHLHLDSDHGDRFLTRLPDGQDVELSPDTELHHFGVDDPREQLRNHPELARIARLKLRGNPVSMTHRRGAAQCRAIGDLQYRFGVPAIREAINAKLDQFYPKAAGRKTSMHQILLDQVAHEQSETPLLLVHVASAVGGQGSAIFVTLAYLTRWLLDQRKAKNFTQIGILLGPHAYRHRERQIDHNYVATLRELEHTYRDGYEQRLSNGEVLSYARPPFDMLFQMDLPEWPAGEDPNDRLSDNGMDEWLRQVAMGVHVFTKRAMHDRLQSLLLNVQGNHEDGSALDFGTLNAALVHGNLAAMDELIAIDKSLIALKAIQDRCGEST